MNSKEDIFKHYIDMYADDIDELDQNLDRIWKNHEKYLQLDEKGVEKRAGLFEIEVPLFNEIMKSISDLKNRGRENKIENCVFYKSKVAKDWFCYIKMVLDGQFKIDNEKHLEELVRQREPNLQYRFQRNFRDKQDDESILFELEK